MRSDSAPDAAPWIPLAGLGLMAAVLALIGLGDLPLRDFDEATVARVALELRHGLGEAPLLPTIWGQPYLNKAPGLHSLIALVIGTTTRPDQLPRSGPSAWRRPCCRAWWCRLEAGCNGCCDRGIAPAPSRPA